MEPASARSSTSHAHFARGPGAIRRQVTAAPCATEGGRSVADVTKFAIETTQSHYVVEDNAGPLADYDEDDPATGAAAIWTSIDGREPIWTNAGVMYFNPRHVILVREVKPAE